MQHFRHVVFSLSPFSGFYQGEVAERFISLLILPFLVYLVLEINFSLGQKQTVLCCCVVGGGGWREGTIIQNDVII